MISIEEVTEDQNESHETITSFVPSTRSFRSHEVFFEIRNWENISQFWSGLVQRNFTVPSFITGSIDSQSSKSYGLTNLSAIHKLGEAEFHSKDPRFKRKTFAIRIGYDGSKYNGYQRQKGVDNVKTVEEDIYKLLNERSTVAAGRTDKLVSAVSQIISFNSYDQISCEDIFELFKSSDAQREGRLTAFEVVRVPKRFHALFCASARRYIYLFPLLEGKYQGGFDVDIDFVNSCFKKLEDKKLHYNGFAFREERIDESGMGDECILHYTNAICVNLDPISPDIIDLNITGNRDKIVCRNPALCIELVGTRFLRRMVRILVVSHHHETINEYVVFGKCFILFF